MSKGESFNNSREITLLYATFPDYSSAQEIGKKLVAGRLAACVNILPSMTSIYLWENTLESASECSMLIKTSLKFAVKARDFIIDHHPYEVPCIISLTSNHELCAQPYLSWIKKTLDAE